jgi:tryptophan halogenase
MLKNITIVGGGSSGYLTAMYLANRYPSTNFTWIFPEENMPIGVGEAIVPNVSEFMREFGVTVEDILRYAEGTLKIGIKFVNFNPGEEFNFPSGPGFDIFDEIIKQHKIPYNIIDDNGLSVHFNASKVLKYFDTIIHRFSNLKVIRDNVDKEKLTGHDLLIDCTGFKRIVADWPNNFISIQDKIPNDQAFVYRADYTNREKQMVPYTIAHAMDNGWTWNIPLRDQLSMGYVHHSKFDVKQEFVDYIENKMQQKIDPNKIVTVKMKIGRNKIHMKDNVVAIGLSSCFIEPLASTGLYITTSSVKRLCEYIDGNITEDDYNQQMNNEYDSLVNFVIAHYKYSNRNNEYWSHYKTVPVEKYRPIDIFPTEAWDFILSGFKQNQNSVSLKNINFKQMINIRKGQEFHNWMEAYR